MKTLFIKLPANLENRHDFEQLIPPYGLAVMSSFLKENGIDIVIMDAQAHQMIKSEIIEYIRGVNPDIIGFSAMTQEFPGVVSLLDDVKEVLPSSKVLIGGPHATTAIPSTILSDKRIDVIVQGEGEYTCLELIKKWETGESIDDVKGIAFRKGDEVVVNERREPIQDLDALPNADWDSLPMDKYFAQVSEKRNYIKFFGSRGCPFQCTFCAAPLIMGKKLRLRSPKSIVEELKLLYDKYHVRDIGFGDSTFNINNKWLGELCEEIIEMNKTRPIIWRCNVRADTTHEETVKLMKEAGCVHVTMGIESGNNAMLQNMKKGETTDDIRKAVAIYNKHKVPVLSSFIFGMPGETLESIQDTVNFAKELNIFTAGFSCATPFPGTEFYDTAIAEGFSEEDLSKLDVTRVSYVPQGMTKDELQKAFQKGSKEYHLRIKQLFKILLGMKSLTNLKIHLRSGLRLIKKIKRGGR